MDTRFANQPGAATMPAMGVDARSVFITRTYNHLFGAIVAFTLIEFALFKSGIAATLAQKMLGVSWLFVLGGFVVVSWLASRFANSASSRGAQYGGLALFVVAEAIIFVPLLYIAESYAPGAIQSAALVTLGAFAGLTAVAFLTRKDFSFLGGLLRWGMILRWWRSSPA